LGGGKATTAASSSNSAADAVGKTAALPPSAKSLPFGQASYPSAKGLNSYDQLSHSVFPFPHDTFRPSPAIGEGNGFVVEATDGVFAIYDTGFGHVTNAEPMELFWAPALIASNYCFTIDPQVHFDTVTRKWYFVQTAFGCAPGSAVLIAVSASADPLSTYNEYVLNTTLDGTVCGAFGCFADQPKIGMNRNALFITFNSYDIATCIGFGNVHPVPPFSGCAFNGAQMYEIDSTALALGSAFPNVGYLDIGGTFLTPEGFDDCGLSTALGGVFASGFPYNPFCWYSIQLATTPAMNFVTDHNGTEFGLSALDWFGSSDNRVALWAVTNTACISQNFLGCVSTVSWATTTTESYGFPFTDTPGYSPYAEQPNSGNTPLCDTIFGGFCEPGPIANGDDRMQQVQSVKFGTAAAHNWAGLNTDAVVTDPLGHAHRRSAIAYFDIQSTGFVNIGFPFGDILTGAAVAGQGYLANWNNDVVFPSIGASSNSGHGAVIAYTVTGNTNAPSVAVNKVTDSSPPTSITAVAGLRGADVLEDASWLFFGNPSFGEYSSAVGDGNTIYAVAEYVQYKSCSDVAFIGDVTCGGTRGFLSNWGTGLVKVNV